MKILHTVLSQGFYGSERYCAELAAAQARDGHDVEILVHGAWSDSAREMRKSVALANTVGAGTLRLVTIPAWAPPALHRMLARRTLQHFRPDIVHSHLNPAARRVGREARRFGIAHVATLHLSYAQREVGDCDGLICIAAWQQATLAGYDGDVTVVYNWVPSVVTDALAETTDQQVSDLRRSWNADDATFVFGTVGRLAPEKGIDRLVDIFRKLFPSGDERVRLIVVGDGPDRAEIARRTQGDPRIVIAGRRENVAPFYRAFDTYISPARFEPFGLSILEAMAAGCPLVLTRTEGPRDFLTDARVLWADVNDDAALATQIVESLALGHRRLAYDLKPFAPERGAEEIMTFYRRVLQRRSGSGSLPQAL